ncbi:MAG: S26 family signal peptidase [Acidimicrobiia bacterium]|nr:S26 family signal peptidase [Acidimicrobiia bacterium]
MGDNRDDSRDSRFFGPVPDEDVTGRAFLRVWPPHPSAGSESPAGEPEVRPPIFWRYRPVAVLSVLGGGAPGGVLVWGAAPDPRSAAPSGSPAPLASWPCCPLALRSRSASLDLHHGSRASLARFSGGGVAG